MTAFDLCIYIPQDIDIEVLLDLENSILTCAEFETMLSTEGIMYFWYEIIAGRSSEFETYVEYECFISDYIGGLPSDMRAIILSQLETFGVSIVDWETGTVLNSPQISLISDLIDIDGEIYEYTLPPGGDFIEHNSKLQRPYDWHE